MPDRPTRPIVLAAVRTPAGDLPAESWWAVRRFAELGGIYFLFPALLYGLRLAGVQVPAVPLLLLSTGLLVAILWRTQRADLRLTWRWRWMPDEARRIGLLFALGAVLLTGAVALWRPEALFQLPRERTGLWAGLMLLYPILSVLPQELVFRVFFDLRYRAILGSRATYIGTSAVAFGAAHLLYGNWVAVILSAIGGGLFSWTYLRTKSLWWPTLEHALYGCFLFTVGLGSYFVD